MSRRSDRVAQVIRHEVGRMLIEKVSDPRVGFVTITRVEVSPDLSLARVYVSVLGEEAAQRLALRGLNSARVRIQRAVGDALSLHKRPDLVFALDGGVKRSIHMSALLNTLAHERGDDRPTPEGEDAPKDESKSEPDLDTTEESEGHGQ